MSRAYPVKYYKCSKRCGYEALRASRRELKQRGKRALIVLAALVVLAVLASGTAVLVEGVSAGGDAPVE